jgi:cell division protein FtsN
MASQNYRNNNKNRKRPTQKSSGAFSWMLATGLLIGLVVFGVYLKSNGLKKLQKHLPENPITEPLAQIISPQSVNGQPGLSPETVEALEQPPEALPPEVENELANEAPQFEFYTMLSEKEVLVPEYEIASRTQQERVVPTTPVESPTVDATTAPEMSVVETPAKSNASYMMQAGSFKNSVDAEKMRANIEAMGIEARVEKGKVGETIYHRIKLGPYAQMTSVSTIRARLKQSGIDVIVTETAIR